MVEENTIRDEQRATPESNIAGNGTAVADRQKAETEIWDPLAYYPRRVVEAASKAR